MELYILTMTYFDGMYFCFRPFSIEKQNTTVDLVHILEPEKSKNGMLTSSEGIHSGPSYGGRSEGR